MATPESTVPATGTTPAAPASAPTTTPAPAAGTPAAAPAAAIPDSKPATTPDSPASKAEPSAAAKPAEGEKPGTPKPAEQKTAVPQAYDIKLPEGSALNPAHVDTVKTFAKENNLSNEQAQKVLERDHAAVTDMHQQLEQKKSEWIKTASNDPEIGGEEFTRNAELSKRVIARFGSEGLKKQLNETGLGNHPELVRTFVRIGKLMSEDQFIFPGGAQQTEKESKSIEDKFYGSSNKGSASA